MAQQNSRYQKFRTNVSGQQGFALTLTTALATTPEINFAEFGYLLLFIPTGSNITGITIYASEFQSNEDLGVSSPSSGAVASQPAPVFLPIVNAGNPVTVSGGNAYDLSTFGIVAAGSLKLVVSSNGGAGPYLAGISCKS